MPPTLEGFPRVAAAPQLLELFLEHVDRGQGLVGLHKLLELGFLLAAQVASVLEKKPAASLHRPAGGLVGSKSVGLVHPHAVDHFAAVLGHDVEEVVDHFGLRAMKLHLQVEGAVLVHRHGLYRLCMLAEQHEEGTQVQAASAFADPQNLPRVGVGDHGGVAMALVEGELVDDQAADLAPRYRRQFAYQPRLVHALDGVPRQADQRGHVLDRQQLAKLLDVANQSAGHLAGAVQLADCFAAHAAIRTAYPANGKLHAEATVQQIAVANSAQDRIVDLEAGLGATAAEGDAAGAKTSEQVPLFKPIHDDYAIAFPKQGTKLSFHPVRRLWSGSSSL